MLATAVVGGLVAISAPSQELPAKAPGSAKIEIATQPQGATVFLDDVEIGASPVEINDLAAGTHWIRLEKRGFVTRTLRADIVPDQPKSLSVTLKASDALTTPSRPNAQTPSTRVQVPKEKGRSRVALAAGGAALGTGLYLLIRNSGPETGTILTLPPGTGLMGATAFIFAAGGASDPEDDPLTFEWTYGDGSTGTGQASAHVYSTAGTFSVGLKVSDNHGHAKAAPSTSVAVGSLTGRWLLTYSSSSYGTESWNLTQSGSTIIGTRQYLGYSYPYTYSVMGRVSDPRRVIFSDSLQGEANAALTEITGVYYGYTTFQLVRQ